MWVNPNRIPRKKFEKLLGLTEEMKRRRLSRIDTFNKSNHAAFILTKDFEIISYGENNYRNMPESMSCHAERQAISNIKQDRLKYNKSYYLFVTKLSPKIGCLGESACCVRCRAMLLNSNLKISRVYYSINNGIAYRNTNQLPIHISERDRNECDRYKIMKLV
jgi:tRNA(Arg) A34 adenosine deaminase TadA